METRPRTWRWAAEARRQELFRRLNLAPGGTQALVRMRAELLTLLPDHPELACVDRDFTHLFSSWFNRGFLVLRHIDWTTPANILEKIIRYEAVHEIRDWNDLRNRLEPTDRRCFAFFHPQLVDEPLIFVEVALTTETPAAIAPLLDLERKPIPRPRRTRRFSIRSRTPAGPRGRLLRQLPHQAGGRGPEARAAEPEDVRDPLPRPGLRGVAEGQRETPDEALLEPAVLRALSVIDDPGFVADPARAEAARRVLMPAAAAYFLKARTAKGRPIDPVARFHLGNGARLERLNPLGDLSAKGLRQSYG